MASQTPTFCGPCGRDNEDSQVARWCSNCNEGLCQNCAKHHRRSLASCKHHLIDKDDISDVLPVLQELPQTCLTHEKQPLSWFCKAHDVICCSLCIQSEHPKCSDVITIDDASQDIDKSAAYVQLKDRINETNKRINSLIEEEKKNEEQKTNIETEILDIRKTINERLDVIESSTRSHLNSIWETHKEREQDVSNRLNDQLQANVTMNRQLTLVEQKGSKTQLFRIIKQLDGKQYEEEKKNLQIEKDLNVKSLTLTPNNALLEAIEQCSSLCEIGIERSKIQSPVSSLPNSQTQVQASDKGPPLLTERQVRESDEKGVFMNSCCFLGNDRYFISCFGAKLTIICDNSFCVVGKVRVEFDPNHVSVVSGSMAALTCHDGYIYIIDTNVYKTVGFTKLGSECDGVTTFEDNLLVCVDKTLTIITYDLENVRAIAHDGNATLVACNEHGLIFYCDFDDSMLRCILSDGNPVFRTELMNFSCPTSITVDKYSRVYVASLDQPSVKCVSSDGENQYDVLSGVLSTPTSIDISKGNMVLVDNQEKLLLYFLE